MAIFELTKEAAEDLFKIWEYTVDTWSEQQADKYYAQLTLSFKKIAEKPSKAGSSYEEIYPGLKGKHVGKHVVFFLPRKDKPTLIVRILHERMDFKRHFL